jgi:F-type H+-transporting ATPase subunit gamma
MSDTTGSLRQKISSASDLQSVVRTMKAVAASSISQYENSVRALADYYHTIELGLGVCIRNTRPKDGFELVEDPPASIAWPFKAVIFGSDQGLIGQFNDVICNFAIQTLATESRPIEIWAVGERVSTRLTDAKMTVKGTFKVPSSIKGIAPLVGQILLESRSQQVTDAVGELYIFYNRPEAGANYAPVSQRLLPLDQQWRNALAQQPWPSKLLPEILGSTDTTILAFVHEYLFVSIFRACAESLTSENEIRLAAMQRAEKNIDELLEHLHRTFHRLRQARIDEELFDVISGFEALSATTKI